MQKTVILNFANSVGRYEQMQIRLKESLKNVGYNGDIMFFNHESEIHNNCPYHKSDDLTHHTQGKVVPYAFKAWAMNRAINDGYENIIWMDAAIYPTKNINEFIEHIEKSGYVFFDNIGYSIGDYTSDACLDKFGWNRQKAFENKMIMACLMGINIHNEKAMEFYRRYFKAAKDGVSYHGSWFNTNGEVSSDLRVLGHRHDQSVASIILKDLEMDILNAQQTFFAYVQHKGVLAVSESVCMWSQGI